MQRQFPVAKARQTLKAGVFWLVILLSGTLLWTIVRGPNRELPEIAYSDLLKEVEAGNVVEVDISGDTLAGKRRDGSGFRVTIPPNQSYTLDLLKDRNVTIRIKSSSGAGWVQTFLSLLPLIVLAVLWFYMIRKMQRRPAGNDPPPWPKR